RASRSMWLTLPMSAPGAVSVIHQEEVLTGEAVALDVQPVGYFLSALGALIDMVTGILLLLLFWFTLIWVFGVDVLTVGPALIIASLAVVMVVIPTAVETVTRGRSLGRLIVGSRIVRMDGG